LGANSLRTFVISSSYALMLDKRSIVYILMGRGIDLEIPSLVEKGVLMFDVTEKAGEVIRKLLEGKGEPQSVRIMMTEGG